MTERQDRPARVGMQTAATIPVIIAVVLGVLYTLGALFKAAELQRANVSVSDYLPLVPLQQILGTGIATLAPHLPLLILLVPLVGSVGNLVDRANRVPRTRTRAEQRALLALAAALTLLAVLVLPPLIGLALLAGLVVVFATRHAREGVFARAATGIALTYLLVGIGFALDYYAHPKPLPVVSLTLSDGTMTRGRLILDTGSTYYIAGDDRRSIVVDHAAVRRVSIRSRSRHSRDTFDYLR